MADHVHDQIKAEIRQTIRGVVETVAMETCPNGFHVDKDDFNRFDDIIRIKQVEHGSECSVPGQVVVEDNGSLNEHQFPGHQSRTASEGHRVQGGAELGISLNPQVVHPVRASGHVHADFDIHREQNSEEVPVPIPARARMEHRNSYDIHTHRIHLAVQADFKIRVYCKKPVKMGAAVGGGLGAVGGAAGGTAGGAALGAVIGSVVPGAGTIVGGVIGGTAGFIGGLIAGGGAAAGAGAGIGAAHSNNMYKTIEAVEVFRKLMEFSNDQTHNTCYCTVIANTTCPYQESTLRGN